MKLGRCFNTAQRASAVTANVVLLASTFACSAAYDVSIGGAPPRPVGDMRDTAAIPADAFVDYLGITTHFGYTESVYATLQETVVMPALTELGVRRVRDKPPLPAQVISAFTQNRQKLLLVCQGLSIADAVALAGSLGGTLDAIEGPSDTDYGPAGFAFDGQTFPEGTRAYQDQLFAAFSNEPALAGLPMVLPTVYTDSNAEILGRLDSGTHCNVHSRRPLEPTPSEDLAQLARASRVICGDSRPMMATSVGYSDLETYPGSVSELVAAKYLMRAALEYFNRGVERFYVYELIDENPDPGGNAPDLHRGLLRADGSKKPAFGALTNLIALLSDLGPAFAPATLAYGLDGATSNLHQSLLQKRDGTFLLLLWQEVASAEPQTGRAVVVPPLSVDVRLGRTATAIEVYQPLDSAQPISQLSAADHVVVHVPDHPLVVRIRF